MRSLAGLFLFAFVAVACGGTTDQPPGPVVSGGQCADVGATAPAADGCNSCVCDDDGWSCTELACPPPEEACTEGETTEAENGCSSCTCSGGRWLCIDFACPPPMEACTEGESKTTDDGCNTCTCSEGDWVCTDAACLPPGAECTPGATKSAGDSCNTCHCDSNGKWGCTLLGCASCTNGYVRPADDACNTCTCDLGQWQCDEACEAATPCSAGTYKSAGDECNTCSCMPDNTWGCTNMDCNPVTCGGFAGDTCTEDEYCAYEANEGGCGILDASATCKARPTECTEEEAPVCGCDGETYSNACLANMAGTGVYTDQPCLPDE